MNNHFECGNTVLIAEDEECLRVLATLTIKAKGFQVLVAANGEEAFRLWQEHANEIVLLFTDIVMPGGMSGFDLAEQIRAEAPGLPVLISSGCSLPSGFRRAPFDESPGLQGTITFLPKPYRQTEISELIESMLAGNGLRAEALAA
jgi:CheY-like chemotaxis protein